MVPAVAEEEHLHAARAGGGVVLVRRGARNEDNTEDRERRNAGEHETGEPTGKQDVPPYDSPGRVCPLTLRATPCRFRQLKKRAVILSPIAHTALMNCVSRLRFFTVG